MRRLLLKLSAIGLALSLASCSPSPAPTQSSSTVSATSGGVEFDVQGACDGFSDVLTVVANAKAGLETGRMAEQERNGWFHLTTSLLERLPTATDHPVARAISELQIVAPHDPGRFEPTTIDSPEWHAATRSVYISCEEAGHEPPTRMFTGG